MGQRQKNEVKPELHWREEGEGDGRKKAGTGITMIIIIIQL